MERRWLPVCFLLMQAAWVTALVEVAAARFGGQGALLGLPVAVATLWVGYLTGRRVLARELPSGSEDAPRPGSALDDRGAPLAVLVLGALWSLAAVWLARHAGDDAAWLQALPSAARGVWGASLADALALSSVFALWWHGQRTAQAPPEHASTVRAFGIGALVLGGALLWSAGLPAPPVGLPLASLLYLGAGLPALSLGRLKEVRRDLAANVVRGEPARLDAAWWRTLAPPVVGVIGAALLAALLLSDAAWRAAILAGLGSAVHGVMALLYLPILLMGYLAEWLIYVLRSLRRPPAEQEAPPAAPGDGAELLRQLQRAHEVPPSLESLRWVALGLVGALALFAYLASSRVVRRARERESAAVVEREALTSWRLLLSDLRRLWQALLRRLGAPPLDSAPPHATDGGLTASPEARDARAAYRALLALGRAHAVPRRPHETPDEYLSAWRAALPAHEEAEELTRAYRRVRYGPTSPAPPGGASIARLRALVGRIQEALVALRPRA